MYIVLEKDTNRFVGILKKQEDNTYSFLPYCQKIKKMHGIENLNDWMSKKDNRYKLVVLKTEHTIIEFLSDRC